MSDGNGNDAAGLPPIIPREELCTRSAWCILRDGHKDGCLETPRGTYPKPDYGPGRKR